MHFIDDRLETVKGVAADAGLRDAGLQVYFAEWCGPSLEGYLQGCCLLHPCGGQMFPTPMFLIC